MIRQHGTRIDHKIHMLFQSGARDIIGAVLIHRIIPCDVHMLPFAVDFYKIPGMAFHGAVNPPRMAGQHLAINTYFSQQQLIGLTITLTHAGSMQQHTFWPIRGKGRS